MCSPLAMPWLLRRSPLAPAVPLEGSDTVQGLSTLERLRRAELLPDAGEARHGGGNGGGGGWRRAYQRYRGPYLEQLTGADLQAAPKGWALFWHGGERGSAADAYSLPASLAVLRERAEVRARDPVISSGLRVSGCQARALTSWPHPHPPHTCRPCRKTW